MSYRQKRLPPLPHLLEEAEVLTVEELAERYDVNPSSVIKAINIQYKMCPDCKQTLKVRDTRPYPLSEIIPDFEGGVIIRQKYCPNCQEMSKSYELSEKSLRELLAMMEELNTYQEKLNILRGLFNAKPNRW